MPVCIGDDKVLLSDETVFSDRARGIHIAGSSASLAWISRSLRLARWHATKRKDSIFILHLLIGLKNGLTQTKILVYCDLGKTK